LRQLPADKYFPAAQLVQAPVESHVTQPALQNWVQLVAVVTHRAHTVLLQATQDEPLS